VESAKRSDFYWIAEIFRIFGGPAAKEADVLSIFGEFCRRFHISERKNVAEMILVVWVFVCKLH